MCEDGGPCTGTAGYWSYSLLLGSVGAGSRSCWVCFSLSPVIGHLPAVALSCLRKLKEGQEDVCFSANTKASAFCCFWLNMALKS